MFEADADTDIKGRSRQKALHQAWLLQKRLGSASVGKYSQYLFFVNVRQLSFCFSYCTASNKTGRPGK